MGQYKPLPARTQQDEGTVALHVGFRGCRQPQLHELQIFLSGGGLIAGGYKRIFFAAAYIELSSRLVLTGSNERPPVAEFRQAEHVDQQVLLQS